MSHHHRRGEGGRFSDFSNKQKFCVVLTGVCVVLIPILILILCESEIKAQPVNQTVSSVNLRGKRSGPKNPDRCAYNARPSTPQIYLCYNTSSFSSIVLVPYTSFTAGGYPGSAWANYPFYVSHTQVKPHWGTIFAYTGSDWDPKNYMTTQEARNWSDILTLSKTRHGLQFMFNTTKHPLPRHPPPSTSFLPNRSGKRTLVNDSCYHFTLFILRGGADLPLFLSLCSNQTAFNANQSSQIQAITVSLTVLETVSKGVIVRNPATLKTDDWFRVTTGISGVNNNWLLMAEQAAQAAAEDCIVCMGPRPLLQVVPAVMNSSCVVEIMTSTSLSSNSSCTYWDTVYPLTGMEKHKPLFSKKVAPGNFTCVNIPGAGQTLGQLSINNCNTNITVKSSEFHPYSRADVWFWCGDDRLFDRFPRNSTGLCALVSLLLPVTIIPTSAYQIVTAAEDLMPGTWHRNRRSTSWQSEEDPTYIDAIGVPRGVPDEYKLVDQIAAGFESTFCWWCTVNKNVDRINYIHYNVQRLGNWTAAGFEAVHGQLSATSLMALQTLRHLSRWHSLQLYSLSVAVAASHASVHC